MTTLNDEQNKLVKIFQDAHICMFTTVADDGELESRPMAVQETEFDGNFYFVTQSGTDVAQQVRANSNVNLSVAGKGEWASVQGEATVSQDVEKLKELWNEANDAWTEGGPENPDNVLITVEVDGGQYWDSPGAPAALVSMIKARFTGEEPEHGTSETVDF